MKALSAKIRTLKPAEKQIKLYNRINFGCTFIPRFLFFILDSWSGMAIMVTPTITKYSFPHSNTQSTRIRRNTTPFQGNLSIFCTWQNLAATNIHINRNMHRADGSSLSGDTSAASLCIWILGPSLLIAAFCNTHTGAKGPESDWYCITNFTENCFAAFPVSFCCLNSAFSLFDQEKPLYHLISSSTSTNSSLFGAACWLRHHRSGAMFYFSTAHRYVSIKLLFRRPSLRLLYQMRPAYWPSTTAT